MTYTLIREILYDYGLDKLDLDTRADIDLYIARQPKRDQIVIQYFARGYSLAYIELYISDARYILESFLRGLAEHMQLYDSLLYRHTKDKQTLESFLTFYNEHWDRLEVIKEIWKNR